MEAKIEYMKWLRNRYISEEDIKYLKTIMEDDEKIEELFGTDLEFEGASISGEPGIGLSKFNNYQIIRAIQAYSNNLIKKAQGRVGRGIAICYDTRKDAAETAESVARTLLGNGISTSLFLSSKPASQLSFAIKYLDLEGGILVGAGNGPKEFGGLTIYNSEGIQMNQAEMDDIAREFRNITELSQLHPYVGFLRLNSIHRKVGPANDYKFFNAFTKQASVSDAIDKSIKIAYSPLHGAGFEVVPEFFEERGFAKFYKVKEQMTADGSFPTVEALGIDAPGAFDMVLELAEEKDADLALITDQDCGRFGAAVKLAGGYRILTEDEAAALLIGYTADNGKGDGGIVICGGECPAVKKAAESAGLQIKEAADFREAGEFIAEAAENDNKVIFTYIQGSGMLAGSYVKEKDGCGSALLFAEMIAFMKKQGTDIESKLEELK